jgi:hypothetical protein
MDTRFPMLQSIYFFRIKYFLVLIDTKLDSICFQLIEVIRQRTNQILNIVNPTESTRLAQDGAATPSPMYSSATEIWHKSMLF